MLVIMDATGGAYNAAAIENAAMITVTNAAPLPLNATAGQSAAAGGYQLENYRIASVLSRGGFSIVYLAYDENDQPVAIKEYLPSQLALRKEGDALPSISDETRDLSLRHAVLLRGRALPRAIVASERGAGVEFLSRQRDRVHGDALRARRTLQEHIHARAGPSRKKFIRHVFTLLLNGLRRCTRTNSFIWTSSPPTSTSATTARPC